MKVRLTFELNFPRDRFSHVLERLVASYGRLSRREAATLTHLTDSSFSRAFQRKYRRSYRSLQTEVRMRVAACLLQHTQLDVSEIAEFLGFGEVGKFQQAFRRFHRDTPVAFRSRKRGRALELRVDGLLHADCRIVLHHVVPRRKSA